jgi:hypothetical protein
MQAFPSKRLLKQRQIPQLTPLASVLAEPIKRRGHQTDTITLDNSARWVADSAKPLASAAKPELSQSEILNLDNSIQKRV